MLSLSLGLSLALASRGLAAVGAGLSFAALCTGLFALWGVSRVTGASLRTLLIELWPPAFAAAATAALLGLVEHYVDAGTRGVLVGLPLLLGELAVACVAYVLCLRTVAPTRATDVVRALRRARRAA
jgi:hypothetical protein